MNQRKKFDKLFNKWLRKLEKEDSRIIIVTDFHRLNKKSESVSK